MPDFDLAVVGSGAAGLSVTAVAAQLGLRVALVERGRMGGDCLNTGCVPSKALLAAAHAAAAARAASPLGVLLPEPRIDWAAVRAHVAGAIATIAPNDSAERFTRLGAEVIAGSARFAGPDTLAIGARRLTARRIVLAVGGRPAIPPIPGLAEVPFLTNETMFCLAEPPAHLLIIGGGPIGLEMAQAHAALGAKVSVVEAAAIAGREDAELAAGLRAALLAQGIALYERARIDSVQPGPVIVLADGTRLSGSHLLVATGRRPNLEGLDLDQGGVRAGPRGIATDAGLRSLSNRRVFAAGDVADPAGIGPRFFTHVGSYHAGIIIRRALFRLPARLDYRALPRVTYTDPELAQVGLTEAEAREAGLRVVVRHAELAENDRAIAEGRREGMVKLVATPRGRVLGAGILAPHAGEMIGLWALAIAQRVKLGAIAGMILPYPTRSESGKRAAATHFAPRLFAAGPRRLVRLLARLP